MSRLDNLPEIIDQQLGHIRLDEGLKDRVRQAAGQSAGAPPARRRAGRRLFAGLAVAAACLGLVLWRLPAPLPPVSDPTAPTVDLTQPAAAHVEVQAQTQAPGGVAVSTAFLITTGDPGLPAERLAAAIEVAPAIDYTVEARGAGDFLLVPRQPLEKNTVYKIGLRGLSGPAEQPEGARTWAFQTESACRVVSTLPADGAAGVPVETGIEITLSRPVAVAEGYFAITPAAEGRLEYYDRTLVFVPTQPLKTDTLYTVTLAEGLETVDGQRLEEPLSFTFRTVQAPWGSQIYYYPSGGITESFLPGDPVALAYYALGPTEGKNIPFDVQVYPLAADDWGRMALEHTRALHPTLGEARDYILDTAGLGQPAITFEAAFQPAQGRYFIILPQALEPGAYLIDLRAADPDQTATPVLQKLVWVSDLAVWSQSLDGQTLLWVNSAADGQPAGGLRAVLSDGEAAAEAETDTQGLAVAQSPKGAGRALLTLENAGQAAFQAVIPVTESAELPANRRYMACLFFDRAAYLPSDTLRYWGFVAPRDGGEALPGGLTLTSNLLPTQAVTPNADGVFSGEITFENILSGYLSLSLSLGGDSLTQAGLQVMDYIKPAYVIGVEADQPYYRKGESVKVQATATFFDGTPAAQLGLQADPQGGAYTTDSRGQIVFVDTPAWGEVRCSWQPGSHYVGLSTSGQEDASVYAGLSALIFPTDYMPRFTVEETAEGRRLQARSNRIDFGAVDAWLAEPDRAAWDPGFEAAVQGEAYEQDFEVEILQDEWVARETETYYDFIHKQARKRYAYDLVTRSVDSFSGRSAGGGYLSPVLDYASAPGISYRLIVRMTTPDGTAIEQTLYLDPSGWGRQGESEYRTYTLWGQAAFDEARGLSVQLMENNLPAPAGGRMLYTLSQDGLMDYGTTADTRLDLPFDPAWIPDLTLMGAYFDGRHIYPAGWMRPSYAAGSRQLQVTVSPDRPSAAPGEALSATVTVQDAQGRPAAGAEFVLSVVDEAALAVLDQQVDLLASLYAPLYPPFPATYVSYVQYGMSGGDYAEMGGEGSAEGIRERFADTAAFVRGRTGEDGTASVAVTLPDNLTAWRLTCAAMTPRGQAGHGTARLAATLPFFVNTVYNEKYAQGDDVVLSSRAAGRSVDASDPVAYTATLTGGGAQHALAAQAAAGSYAYFNFGKLPAGRYALTLEARCGDLRDAVAYTVTVVDSLLELPAGGKVDLAGLAGLQSLRYPVTLAFYDQALELYLDTLYGLLEQTGLRADHRLARAEAERALWALDPGSSEAPAADLSDLARYDGALALLPYGEADPGLTARALAACPQRLNAAAAEKYLYSVLYRRGSDARSVAWACLGLAARGQPVLLDIRALLAQTDDLQDTLTLATGLALLGDLDGAGEIFDARVTPALKPYGTAAEGKLYLEAPATAAGDATWARAALNTQAAALAAALGRFEAEGLARYCLETGAVENDPLSLLYVLNSLPRPQSAEAATVSYTLDGQAVRHTLDAQNPVHRVSLDAAQLAAAGFETAGRVGVRAAFVTGSEGLVDPLPQDRATLTKTYTALPGGQTQITLAVQIKTGLDPVLDGLYAGPYTVTDVLPSGLRFVRWAANYQSGVHLLEEDGGRLSFGLDTRRWEDGGWRGSFSITYIARTALPGSFVTDSAVLRHMATGQTLATPRGSLSMAP